MQASCAKSSNNTTFKPIHPPPKYHTDLLAGLKDAIGLNTVLTSTFQLTVAIVALARVAWGGSVMACSVPPSIRFTWAKIT